MKTTFRVIFKIFCGLFTTLGALVFILSLVGIISFYKNLGDHFEQKPLPDQFMISLELNGVLNDINGTPTFIDRVMGTEMDLKQFLIMLEYAANDTRVIGLKVKVNDGDYSVTQIDTIRKAVLKFAQTGKQTIAFSHSFGDFSNGTSEYWLASAFDEIVVQPAGFVSLNGLLIEQHYLKEALNKIGVEPEMVQRKSYKTGGEIYTRSSMSDESRETLTDIVGNVMNQIINDIAVARNLAPNVVQNAMNTSPLTADDAYKFGLIDKIAYADDIKKPMRELHDDYFVSVQSYLTDHHKNDEQHSQLPKVAIIKVKGMIADEVVSQGKSPISNAMVLPGDIADGETISNAIKFATDIESIKVILIRVNSPGGSPTASEKIRHAVTYARDNGKFTIVSMGDVAASGGYWISVNANQIIASPLTITGSIGVYGGKMNFQGLWDKLGIQWDSVSAGDNATIWSFNQGYDDAERVRLDHMMDYIYDGFVKRVAKGRSLSIEDVESVAQGRAWLGKDAKEHNLVDLNGGFAFALKRAAAEAEESDWKTMPTMILPVQDDPFVEVIELLGVQMPKIQMPSVLQNMMYQDAVLTVPYSTIQF
jgi:protease-4